MAIKITDNFQVNIKNPIDNRFVVGSQSIPGVIGTVYPTPFYAYRDDISSNIGFVYPGLRIWDFNENLPYVWTGTTWSNENLTGASVEGSGNPGGTGFENYVVKFKNNATVLTKSLLFDNYEHVGLGIITGINPNNTSGIVGYQSGATLNLPASGLTQGLHVQGHIKTNSGFIGDGKYIGNINAGNITGGPLTTGRLALQYINANNLFLDSYVLTTDGAASPTSTIWKKVVDVVPHWQPTNLGLGNSGAVSLYSGENGSNQYEFFSLVSTGLDITDGTTGAGSVRIESKPGVDGRNGAGGSSDAISIYNFNTVTKRHEFLKIKSNSLKISLGTGTDNGNLVIESPETGSARALYVNITYIPTYDDWKKAYDSQNIPGAPVGRFLSATGHYRGDGTLARPFTNSIKYNLGTPGVPGTLVGTIQDTSIQNGLDWYINEFGTAPYGSVTNPYYRYETLTIQGATTYFFGGNFNIQDFRLKIDASNVISTTTGFLIDLDDISIFPASAGVTILITIEKDCQLEIRGSLVPDNSYLGGAGVFWPLTGGTLRQGGKGFRCSGSDISTTNYSGSLHQILFRGDGTILSLYKPNVGSSGTYGPTRIQNDNLFIFNLDENNDKMSNNPEYTGGPTPVIGYNNDGHICIQVDCNVTTRYQGIFMIGGKSKLEFTKGIGTGQLTDTLYSSSGYLYDNDCYYSKGGLIRFFDAKISVSSGARKSYFIIEPNLNKQVWDIIDGNGNPTAGGYGRINGAYPNFIFRNCRLGGPSVNLFDKRTQGVASVDMLNCTSLYFSANNLVSTDFFENWSGVVDQRWGCQWNPAVGWNPSVPYGSTNGGKFNGSFTFKNNVLEQTSYNPYVVDLTLANGQSAMNTIGAHVVNTLQRFASVAIAVSTSFQLQRGSQFINFGTTQTNALIVGKSYMIALVGAGAYSQWTNRGYNVTTLGTPGPNKMFNCTSSGGLTSGYAYEVKIDFVP